MYAAFQSTASSLNEDASLGILKHLNRDELTKLLDDNVKLEELITDDAQIKAISVEKGNLLTNNTSIAEYNLAQEPKLAAAKQELASLYEQWVSVQKEYEERKLKIDAKSSKYSLDTICALLQTEAAKSEEQSERIADEFLNGSMEVETFLERFIPQRTIAHERKVKSEKLEEMVRSGVSNSSSGFTAPPIAAPRPARWGAPYPMAMPNAASYLPK